MENILDTEVRDYVFQGHSILVYQHRPRVHRLMDAGKMLKAKIAEIKHGEWYTKINISIFLVDL